MRKPSSRPAREAGKARASQIQEIPPVPPSLESGESAILRQMRDMQLEIDSLRKAVLSETNMRTLESEISRELRHMKSELRESMEKNRHSIDRMEAEIKFIREDMGRVMSLESELSKLNAESLARDVESLKVKSRWLETSLKGFDIDPLVEKISEMEHKIRVLKASQPLILE